MRCNETKLLGTDRLELRARWTHVPCFVVVNVPLLFKASVETEPLPQHNTRHILSICFLFTPPLNAFFT